MDSLLLYGIKGCFYMGGAALATGILSSIRLETPKDDLGVLCDTLSPHLQRLRDVCHHYPDARRVFKRIKANTIKFAKAFHEPSRKATRTMLRLQRAIFEDIDDIAMELSESTALEDIYRASDDLKQAFTDLCLSVDK